MKPPPRTRAGIMDGLDSDSDAVLHCSCCLRINLALCSAPDISGSNGRRATFAPRSTGPS